MAPISQGHTWYDPPSYENRGQWLSPPLRLAGTTQCRGGWSYPSTTDLVLIVAESQCTGLYRAGYHPGCCLWGVGSGCTDTTKHRLTRGLRKAGKKGQRRGGKIAPEVEYNTGKEERGWMEGEGKRQWGKVQNGSSGFAPLRLCFFFPCHFILCFIISDFFSPVICIYMIFVSYLSVPLQPLFHSTFGIFAVIVAHSGRICRPRWINLTVWPCWHVVFTFDPTYIRFYRHIWRRGVAAVWQLWHSIDESVSFMAGEWLVHAFLALQPKLPKSKNKQWDIVIFEHSFFSHDILSLWYVFCLDLNPNFIEKKHLNDNLVAALK